MKRFIPIWAVLFFLPCKAQDSASAEKKMQVTGYVKNVESLIFDGDMADIMSGNLIHNRFNLRWKPGRTITLAAELRNRLFWGEQVKLTPGFSAMLKNRNEKLNLQKIWVDNKNLVLHSNVERLYIDCRVKMMNIRLGRQRINWGTTTTWNPNDIFNTYNFLDFDYEERPGSDAVKVHYNFGDASIAEWACAFTDEKTGRVTALKYSFNKWNYDMQVIAGWYKEHATVGAGWAGYVYDAGLKGELQYLFGSRGVPAHLNAVLETDYMFKKGLYVNAALLYVKNGLNRPVQYGELINLDLSQENLMPTRWNIILTTAKEFTPLFSLNTGFLYAPGTNLLIFLPSCNYNISENADISFTWQSFFGTTVNKFDAITHRCFFRLKWSY